MIKCKQKYMFYNHDGFSFLFLFFKLKTFTQTMGFGMTFKQVYLTANVTWRSIY